LIDWRLPVASALIWGALVGARVPVMGQTRAATEAGQVVVIGCIRQAATELTITDYRGGPAPTFRLDAGDSRLTPWVNDTVEIHGTIVAGSGGADSKEPPRLSVSSVYLISRGCKETPPKSA
jgi:hypothetical protein